jgi:diguanylate cyclase (GGDEF)-like protein/hemerythrin-like metal-binding protein/PAS domain S-box-containing protein
MHDVTERARAEARVVAESARFKAFLRVSTDGVHILDSHAQLVEASDSFFAMLGYEREELLGARPDKWDAKVDLEANRMQVLTGVLWKFETCHRRKDGTFIDVEVNTEGFHYDGAQYLFCASRDISDRKLSERRIVHLATHDALTGLPNRTLLRDRLARSLSQALRDGTSGALLMLDLDGFKLVNDQYGHEAGDKVLQVVASRLYRLVRDSDSVARLGGDEFAIVLDAISGEQAIRAFAGQVIQQVSLPVALDNGTPVSVGASVGAAPFPATGSNRRALLAAADRAMYVSKHAGHNLCTVSTDVSDPEEPGSQLFNAGLLPDLGLSGMDLAHESLASMLTGIEVAMAAGAARPVLLQLLDDVTAVASSHFREEERWMEQAGYPDIEAHELAHAQLLDEFAKLRSGTAAGSNNSPVKALKDWLMIHMEAFDQPLAQFLLAGQEPGKAPA